MVFPVFGSFMIGFDGEKSGAGERIASFIDTTNIPVSVFNKLQAIPNTKLWDRLKTEGRLKEDIGSGDFLSKELNFVPLRRRSRH